MEDERVIRAMRTMAWERAKGEMQSMLHTYYESSTGDYFQQFNHAFREFVRKVEDHGWQE